MMKCFGNYYIDVTMSAMAQITSVSIVYSTVGPDERKHQSSASLAFAWGIHRWPVSFPVHSNHVIQRSYRITAIKHTLLTHWGRVTHICVANPTVIGSDNGLSPSRRQAIIWSNAAILSIGPQRTHVNKILIETHIFSFKNALQKAILSRPHCVKGGSVGRQPACSFVVGGIVVSHR